MTETTNEVPKVEIVPRWLALFIMVGALVALFIVFGAYVFKFGRGPISPEAADWGTFGDYVGGVLNPVYGFFGLLALLATLLVQSRELKLSTEELRKSALALDAQNKSLAQQNFENTFFQLLRKFSEVAADLSDPDQGKHGRAAARSIFDDLLRRFGAMTEVPEKERAARAYEALYSHYHSELGHYFRTLFHLIKFVNLAPGLTDEERARYANIARAQLSTYELSLLFYNCTWGEGLRGFRPLITKYGLLKHVDPTCLLRREHKDDRDLFDFTAFIGYDERLAYRGGMRGTLPGMSRT